MTTISASKDSFKASRKFYDDINYPRGMGRSGDFTLAEVQILENHGIALQALANGTREPINEEEKHFTAVCQNQHLPVSKIEKAWLKYQNKVLSPKQFHTLFGRTKVEVNDEDSISESLDIESG